MSGMLVGFSVCNYRSFQDAQNISMLASKIARHKFHITTVGARKLLKSALIFGANASGKSNFIKAVAFSRDIILKGLDEVDIVKEYFRIDGNMYSQPGIFQYQIIINGQEYSYGLAISYEKKTILAEWLVKIGKNGEEQYVFNREIDEMGVCHVETEMTYENPEENARMKVYLEDFGEEISALYTKKSILSNIATKVNDKSNLFRDIVLVYEWLKNIVIIFPTSKYRKLNDVTTDKDVREFFGNLLSFFDTGVVGVENQEEKMDFDKVFQDMPVEEAEKIKVDISNNIDNEPIVLRINKKIYILRRGEKGNIIYNKMLLNHGNPEELFEYLDESDGTRRLLDLSPILFQNNKYSVVFIDEIDRSFHTSLTKRFLQKYYEIFANDACQIILTTHDINLLDLDLLRQDEIWFVERRENHSSELYSLSRYKERFDKRIDKEYLLGRYGAIPIFDENLNISEVADEE
ncbi:MAG: ATP-binding protein [Lachnospiraceae bacterium]|nr:ATP-binding protein [Lachnospiraceae bacterium]